MIALRFEGNEIVRLKADHPDDQLKAGDCGLVWGVYNLDPPLYEASFVDEAGEFVDMMFREEEVEELTNPQEAPSIKRLEELRRELEDFNAKLRQEKSTCNDRHQTTQSLQVPPSQVNTKQS